MDFKGALGIPLANPFVRLHPAKFEISRSGWAAPIGRGLVCGDPPSEPFFYNNSVI